MKSLKDSWEEWEKKIPEIPPDALVTLVYTKADMP
jgi:hypothetical protein